MDEHPWDAESVLAASNAWTWIPEGSRHARTREYLVVAGPEYLLKPTTVRVFGSDRSSAELVDEITTIVAGWGRHRVTWRLSDATRQAGLERELVRRGATVTDRMDVLALHLADCLPDFDVPPEVTVRRVDDEQTLRDAYLVSTDAFGGDELTPEQLSAELGEIRRGLPEGPVGRVVAYVDGRPAGTGGWTLVRPVCRLWGGATHRSLRRRGAYRAVLAERLRLAREDGATLALTHGVVDTSSPVLARLGFTRYGEERSLVLDLG